MIIYDRARKKELESSPGVVVAPPTRGERGKVL